MFILKNICAKYSYKTVLDGVSLSFEKGKIYALLGQNGAGKSTLAHIICGDIKPTSGKMFFDNTEVIFNNPHDAIQNGIVCVHQRPLLSSSISINENLKLGQKKIDLKKEQELLSTWIPGKKTSTIVKSLSEEEKFYVSLTGALLRNPRFLILDEPPYIPLEKLRQLTDKGISILMITHNLQEALQKSDEIILLQNGNVLEKKETANYTEDEIKQKLFNISTEVKMPSFIKTENITEDEVFNLHSKKKNKIGYIPSDKNFRASNPKLSILQLICVYQPMKKQSQMETFATNILQKSEVNIRLYEKANCLSGGMLQRIILEREIAESPKKLYLFNPTKGLDVEATEHLYNKLKKLNEKGTEIIIGINQLEN